MIVIDMLTQRKTEVVEPAPAKPGIVRFHLRLEDGPEFLRPLVTITELPPRPPKQETTP